jgi:hypothetical protein
MAVVGRKKRGELEGEKKKKRCKWIAQRNESGFTQGCGDKLDSCTRYIGRGQSERHCSSGRPFCIVIVHKPRATDQISIYRHFDGAGQ